AASSPARATPKAELPAEWGQRFLALGRNSALGFLRTPAFSGGQGQPGKSASALGRRRKEPQARRDRSSRFRVQPVRKRGQYLSGTVLQSSSAPHRTFVRGDIGSSCS